MLVRAQVLCWLAVIAQIFAPLSGLFHHAAIAHHFCFEHGVDEHAPAVDRDTLEDCVAESHRSEAPAKHDPVPHDRCDQPIQLHVADLTPHADERACVGSVSAPLERATFRAVPLPIPLLRQAPKTPPPFLA